MQYRRKQYELKEAGVSLVKIDLLRSGDWVLQLQRSRIGARFRTPYRACVHRGWKPDEYEYYRMPIEQRLPRIRIPLREHDSDARLDLQALIDQTYLNGAYDGLDYSQPPFPPLGDPLAAWANELLHHAGRK